METRTKTKSIKPSTKYPDAQYVKPVYTAKKTQKRNKRAADHKEQLEIEKAYSEWKENTVDSIEEELKSPEVMELENFIQNESDNAYNNVVSQLTKELELEDFANMIDHSNEFYCVQSPSIEQTDYQMACNASVFQLRDSMDFFVQCFGEQFDPRLFDEYLFMCRERGHIPIDAFTWKQ